MPHPFTLGHDHKYLVVALALSCLLPLLAGWESFAANSDQGDSARTLTPLQLEVEKQRQRLSSNEAEERRDAVMQLGALRHPEASRAAASALNDLLPIVRATATGAILSLSHTEASTLLIPLLNDKDEFVRQEAAYALGKTRSKSTVTQLIERLTSDKKDGVRAAAAVALGEIGDESAVTSLMQVLSPQTILADAKKARSSKRKANVFVLRSAAHSLGQIASRQAVPALVAVLEDDMTEDDLRREAAIALGRIGDPSALPALQKALNAEDPHLSLAAREALRRISRLPVGRPS